MDWFLYDNGLHHERVKIFGRFLIENFVYDKVTNFQTSILLKMELLQLFFYRILFTLWEYLFQETYFNDYFHDLIFQTTAFVLIDFLFEWAISVKLNTCT